MILKVPVFSKEQVKEKRCYRMNISRVALITVLSRCPLSPTRNGRRIKKKYNNSYF